jgi:Xaa-Pro dipeptidase
MPLHFTPAEFERRRGATLAAMAQDRLDGLLMFRQESMYWLTGYDTFGFCFFQCLVMSARGDIKLLTRKPDLRQAKLTSNITDIRIWKDAEAANPALDLKELLKEMRLEGKTLGVEYEAYGLTARNGKRLDGALEGFAKLVDASFLVSRIRIVKSEEELAYIRKAGAIADLMLEDCYRLCRPGAWEGDIIAAMEATNLRNDGDPPGNENIIGSGKMAALGRYHAGRRHLDHDDQLLVEFAAAYRHYHACLMNVVVTGRVDARHRDMFRACREALTACQTTLRPGRTVGDIFATHARALTRAGYKNHMLNACGYTLGATYPPTWMDEPMIYADHPQVLAPGMVFFTHMILLNSRTGLSMSLGETSIITARGAEPVTHAPRALVAN